LEGLQDEDVLDTWFSSWLWPIEVFKALPDRVMKTLILLSYFCIGNRTGYHFLLVARMIMAEWIQA